MIEAVVQEKRRKARKKTRLRWPVRLDSRFPPMPALHGAVRPQKPGNSAGTGMALGRTAVLEAAVDVPAEVVEARRDDGDREDVLHRRRHDVLATRDARFVRHEADVDQPHDHDGEEVEDLQQDQAVEVDLLLKLLRGRRLSEKRGQHGRKRRGHQALLGTHARALRHTNPRTTVRNGSDAAQVRALHLFQTWSVERPHRPPISRAPSLPIPSPSRRERSRTPL